MEVFDTPLVGAKVIKPKSFGDDRGYFFESFNQERYRKALGIDNLSFVQDNVSFSEKGVLRGLHIQSPMSQGKLVSVMAGEVFDVAVDLRKDSPSFGKWHAVNLNADNKLQFWIPRGFAHGFVVTSATAIFTYKCDEYYAPQHELSISWNDPDLAISWPKGFEFKLSKKDMEAKSFQELIKIPNFSL